MGNKQLPRLSEDKSIKSERIIPETVGEAKGCRHELILNGYEVRCTKCPLGLFVSSYRDYLDLTKRLEKIQ